MKTVKQSQMTDLTFNFMFYLKYHRPKVHDSFVAMLFMGVNPARGMLEEIFKTYAKPCKFPEEWTVNSINLFQIRADLISGHWHSQTWDRLADSAIRRAELKEKLTNAITKLTL